MEVRGQGKPFEAAFMVKPKTGVKNVLVVRAANGSGDNEVSATSPSIKIAIYNLVEEVSRSCRHLHILLPSLSIADDHEEGVACEKMQSRYLGIIDGPYKVVLVGLSENTFVLGFPGE
jgi:hypothetical protein